MKKSPRKLVWIIGILVVLAVAAVIVVTRINKQNAASASIQTQTLEKGDLLAIVGATGSVRANQTTTLSWQTNGRVAAVNMTVGDLVAAGQTLAELAETSLPQSVILAKAELVNAQRSLDNLVNSNANQAQAQLNLANAQQAYNSALWNKQASNTSRVVNPDQVDAASAAVTLAHDRVDKAEENYDRFDERADSDPLKAGALSNLANARIALENAQKTLNYYTQTPNTQEVSISEGKIAVAQALLEDAQREWDRLKDGPDPDDIAAAQARVASIQATIDLVRITVPFDGTLTDVNVLPGDQVNAGSIAFRIDDLSRMLVDVMVPEVDINSIKVGQEVDMTFDAISNRAYTGKVVEVARVGTTSAGVVNFEVTIEILDADEQVLPGMTAAVNIVISNLQDILLIPNRAVRLVDGKRVIYLLKNGVQTAVEIEIGASSDTMSEFVSGDVKEGDVIILNPTIDFSSFSSGRPPF
jgi:HlyD family secretion protein